MRKILPFNTGWKFYDWFESRLIAEEGAGKCVTIPHNAVDVPLNYFNESCWERKFCYQATLDWSSEFMNKEVSLLFDGAMADTLVFLNGDLIAQHKDGYTPFCANLSQGLNRGSNLITVVIDGTEASEIPPFGGLIDYLTYAGIYRDVWLRILDSLHITQVKIETPNPTAPMKTLKVWCELSKDVNQSDGLEATVKLVDKSGRLLASDTVQPTNRQFGLVVEEIWDIDLWDVDYPVLYDAEVEIVHAEGRDSVSSAVGFRSAEFTPDGFFLNGRLLKIRGLNRHQSYPYVGYAMGRRAQERDARILKNDLNCNLVRTSHYPQSRWFLDHCDRIGLLVFEEVPGWQHVGGRSWQEQTIGNVEAMIRRDWNRPSIVIWGVRINESADCHDLYERTNALARSLDPTRQTGGVRNIAGSEFLEDVYTMNDFVLGSEQMPGANHSRTALRSQAEVTGLPNPVPYLVTECNGHMYPTKRVDSEERQLEHVIRHLTVLDGMYGDLQISGCISWCFADYNTHLDFGSGDRICHHGVLDMFRVPKFASFAYASQRNPDDKVVLKPVTVWARGERSIGGVLPLLVLTNCDEVHLRYGTELLATAFPDRAAYPNLPYPPVVFTDRDFSEGLGHWGMEWKGLTMLGYVAGQLRAQVEMVENPILEDLRITPDSPHLLAGEQDEVRVVVEAIDQVGNTLPYFDDPLRIKLDGPACVLGPGLISFRGGVAAFWIRSELKTGEATLTLRTERCGPKQIVMPII